MLQVLTEELGPAVGEDPMLKPVKPVEAPEQKMLVILVWMCAGSGGGEVEISTVESTVTSTRETSP